MTNLGDIAANASVPVTAAEVLAALNGATGSIDADLLTLAPGGGAPPTTITPLATDAFTESAAITSYPLGISIMPVSVGADWDGTGTSGHVITDRTSTAGSQRLVLAGGGEEFRLWEGAAWSAWQGWALSTHTHENIVPLPTDQHTEAQAITSYPEGISIMPASAAADWDGNGEDTTVVTHRTSNSGWQTYSTRAGGNNMGVRTWHDGVGWDSWAYPAFTNTLKYLNNLPADFSVEAAAITDYPGGFSQMPATAGANWGPNTGEAGHVITERNGSIGKQTFSVPSTSTSYVRYYTSGAWGAWINGRTPLAHASTHQPGGSDAMAVDAAAATGSLRTLGTGAAQAAAGNDSRLSNARTPTAHAASHQPGGGDAMAVDQAAATASLRTLGSGATQAAPGNDARLSDARTPATREWDATFFYGGNLSAQVGVGGEPVPNSGTPTITEVSVYVNTKPTTQNVIVDINSVNLSTGVKTTLYTTQGNRPQITPGGNYRINATLPDITQPGVGSVLTADIDQVGSGTVGANLTVKVRGTY